MPEGSRWGGIPVDLQNMVKSLLMGFECLVAWGGVIRYPQMVLKQVVLGDDGGSYNDCFCLQFR
jgi:hypothetical protein